MRIDTSKINGWRIASKCRPVKAKPLINLIVDKTVANKFLVDTLEGHEPLGDGSVICVGEAGDAWQQTPKKLLQKYSVVGIDKDGWMDCQPLPDNAVNCVEVGSDFFALFNNGHIPSPMNSEFTIIGQWGATVNGEKNVQNGTVGDFICQNQTDLSDVWVVRRRLFLNTYAIKS